MQHMDVMVQGLQRISSAPDELDRLAQKTVVGQRWCIGWEAEGFGAGWRRVDINVTVSCKDRKEGREGQTMMRESDT